MEPLPHPPQMQFLFKISSFIGTSLSEPHTSMTTLHMCVCMLACGHILYILNEYVHILILYLCSVGEA